MSVNHTSFLRGRIVRNLQTLGDRTAVRSAQGEFSYQTLLAMSDQLVDFIAAHIPLTRDTVVLTCSSSPLLANVVNILLGIAGLPYEPLSLSEPAERLRTKAAKWRRYVLLTDSATRPTIRRLAERALLTVTLNADNPAVMAASLGTGGTEPNPFDLGAYAYILSTSGSSGTPKAVPITQQNLQAYLETACLYFAIKRPMSFSAFHDVTFDFNIHEVYLPLFTHGTICIAERSNLLCPGAVQAYVRRYELEFWSCVPSLVNHLGHLRKHHDYRYESIEKTMLCGEPLSPGIYQIWREMAPASQIYNIYGPTECTVAVSGKDITEYQESDLRAGVFTIGRPFAGVELRVYRQGQICRGGTGELLIGGPQVFKGYLSDIDSDTDSNTDLLTDRLLYEPQGKPCYYRTGDQASIDDDGQVYFIGRGDDQLQIRGHRIQKNDIVSAIRRAVPCSNLAVVEKISANRTTVGVVLFISGVTLNEIEIRHRLAEVLPGYALPLKINIGPIPMNKNMKNDYQRLFDSVNTPPVAARQPPRARP